MGNNDDKTFLSWRKDQLSIIPYLNGTDELYEHFSKGIKKLGFDYLAFGLMLSNPITKPSIKLVNNYPDSWKQLYVDKGYLAVDPSIEQGHKSSSPFLWSEDLFSNTRNFWEEARAHGLSYGWVQSNKPSPGLSSLITLARADSELSRSELFYLEPYLFWFSQVAQHKLQQSFKDDEAFYPSIDLTEREKEVLKWMAIGKSAEEIAYILSVQARTVTFHSNNAQRKLCVSNKTAAVVKAIQLALI